MGVQRPARQGRHGAQRGRWPGIEGGRHIHKKGRRVMKALMNGPTFGFKLTNRETHIGPFSMGHFGTMEMAQAAAIDFLLTINSDALMTNSRGSEGAVLPETLLINRLIGGA